MGESKIIGPDGLDIVNAEQGEKLITAEIDSSTIKVVREKLPYLKDSISLHWKEPMAIHKIPLKNYSLEWNGSIKESFFKLI